MSSAPQKFFLTTPIYYVNARPHIGHAYTTIVADVLARRSRAQGTDTFFLTGTDEHGQKIERSAQAAGVPPQQFADQVSAEFRALWDRMGLTYDKYIRTTDEAHKRGVQKLWRELESRGHIYLDSYTGAYCVSDESFVDVPAGAPCPDCGRPTETVTEENYFFRLSAFQQPVIDLIESGQLIIEPDARRNEVLSFLRGGLKDLSISRSSFTWGIPVPTDILSSRSVAEGSASSPTTKDHVIYVWLDALANYMTAIGYGSDDPVDMAQFEKYWPADLHIVGKEIIRFHCVYWPAFLLAAGLPTPKKVVAHGWLLFEESKMSKSKGNIVRTETILDAFGTLCPPSTSERNGTPPGVPQADLDLKGRGFSPAADTPVESPALAAEGMSNPTSHDRDLFAADVLRYFLLREIPFGQDGSFSFDALITRYNADLANGYGNLVSRTLNLIVKGCGGLVPPVHVGGFARYGESNDPVRWTLGTPWSESTELTWRELPTLEQMFAVQLNENKLSLAMELIQEAISTVDGHLSFSAPWKLIPADTPDRIYELQRCLYTAAESIRIITALLYPILPYATANVWRQLGLGDIEQAAKNGDLKNLQWGGLIPGTKLGPLSPIFPRADKSLAQKMSDMEQAKNLLKQAEQTPTPETTKTELPGAPIASESVESVLSFSPDAPPRTTTFTEPNPGSQVAASAAVTTERAPVPTPNDQLSTSPSISIDDFIKVDLRVARILVAERIPKADKLLRLEVDLGYEKRQILSGIAEWYTPEELVGRRIVVIVNLAPRKMRGLESHGMLLAASTEGGKPHLATCGDSDDLPLGSRLK